MFEQNLPRQLVKILPHVSCSVPLCDVDECQCKKCDDNAKYNPKNYVVPEKNHLDTTDKYWAEFLKAQQTSSINYLYHMNIYGDNKDPTLEPRNPFPPELIHQRLLHMPVVGNLDKGDIFYILTFILNLLQLNTEKQQEYLEMFHEEGLVNNHLLNYMQIIARHPNTGIPHEQLDDFLDITNDIIFRTSNECNSNFFNPDRIFMKSMVEMDPYELEYLKGIMETKDHLNNEQYMYLVNFVERLQEMPLARREEYLKALHEKKILGSASFPALTCYIKNKSRKFDRQKLITLWRRLETLMDIGPCFPKPVEEKKVAERVTEIDIDALKIYKALVDITTNKIPNVIRVRDLKNFLQDLMHLSVDQMETVLNQLKNMRVIKLEQFKLLHNFTLKEGVKGDEEKKKLLQKTLLKVGSTPPSETPNVVLAVPPSKGPTGTPVKPLPNETAKHAKQPTSEQKDAAAKDDKAKKDEKAKPEEKPKKEEKSKKCKKKKDKGAKTKGKAKAKDKGKSKGKGKDKKQQKRKVIWGKL